MATYDITQTTPSKIKMGDILDCPYSGAATSITLPKGVYKLECWGAQGGSYSSYYGGLGGYSVGVLSVEQDTLLYCYVGGQPDTVSILKNVVPGGFNGGGDGYNRYYNGTATVGQGGGGGTDIRVGSDSLYARILVAGGGGGSASKDAQTIKYGGGLSGGCPSSTYTASQTAAGANGSFGIGGSTTTKGSGYKYGSGGGGGGWYGGGACHEYSDSTTYITYRDYNGGGSGYVFTEDTASNYPDGCLLTAEYYLSDASTIDGATSFIDYDGTTVTGHSGNGYIRITVVKMDSFQIKTEDGWKNAQNVFYKTISNLRRIEYIESSGTQYIDTGFKANQDTRVTMDVMHTGDLSSNIALFGGRDALDGISFTLWWYVANAASRFDYIGEVSNKISTGYIVENNTRVTVDANKNEWTLGEYSTSMTYTDFQTSYNLILFGVNTTGTIGNNFVGQIYSCKIYDNDMLIRDFVPVLDDNNIPCLYDKVEEKLYYSKSSESFAAGNILSTDSSTNETISLIRWVTPKSIYSKAEDDNVISWKQIM